MRHPVSGESSQGGFSTHEKTLERPDARDAETASESDAASLLPRGRVAWRTAPISLLTSDTDRNAASQFPVPSEQSAVALAVVCPHVTTRVYTFPSPQA